MVASRCRGVDREAALDGHADVAGLVDGAHPDGVRAAREAGVLVRAGARHERAVVEAALERGSGFAGERHARGRAGHGHVADRGCRCRGVDHEAALDGSADVAGLVDGAHPDGVRAVGEAGVLVRAGARHERAVVEAALERGSGFAGERHARGGAGHGHVADGGCRCRGVDRRSCARRPAPTLPAWSMARTRTVCVPLGEAGVLVRAGARHERAVVEAALERGSGFARERHARGRAGHGHVADGRCRCRGVDRRSCARRPAPTLPAWSMARTRTVCVAVGQAGVLARAGARHERPLSRLHSNRGSGLARERHARGGAGHGHAADGRLRAVVSITKLRSAATPTLPAWSMARTRTVCEPLGQAGVLARAGAGLRTGRCRGCTRTWRPCCRWRT